GTWQNEAVDRLYRALRSVVPNVDAVHVRVPLRQWFAGFVTLRNSTRGHGATTPEACIKLSPDLEQSIKLIVEHLPILQRPWGFFHHNLSGKFRVIPLGGPPPSFEQLKTAAGSARYRHLTDGVYVDFQEYAKVDLIDTGIDVADFFFPNGGFKGTT